MVSQIYVNLKKFTSHTTHELQTPLAIATNKLELILEKGDLGDANAGSIADVLRIIERLTQLNKSLLLLSKIENKQNFPLLIHTHTNTHHRYPSSTNKSYNEEGVLS